MDKLHFKWFAFLTVLCETYGEMTFIAEFEDIPSWRHRAYNPALNFYTSSRSNASGNQALHILDEGGHTWAYMYLCLYPKDGFGGQNTSFTMNNIRYSNDGGSDELTLRLNGARFGQVTTVESYNNGYGWNVFRNSGPIGETVNVSPGQYRFSISIKANMYGVELDQIKFSVGNDNYSSNVICRKPTFGLRFTRSRKEWKPFW